MNRNILVSELSQTSRRLLRHADILKNHEGTLDTIVRKVRIGVTQRSGVARQHAKSSGDIGFIERIFVVERVGESHETAKPILTGLCLGYLEASRNGRGQRSLLVAWDPLV